ncbi:alpha/beta fold hydrolase [Acinetobacter shaoyimingii]|uniref:Alpha/beta fold hydrolase n=1 Tax=Acinetobacter shaoyimingii TaxID=2715164 RepID=A0A6G8RZT7_9GAMM|nr:alpha/beta fold hydrolase [Acinetobacter shaoyimingii]QIO07466.1 alpha/beta fold hydrolase [Acinetobacter shaoyimingii]
MHHLKRKFRNQRLKLKNLSTRIFYGKSLVLSQATSYDVIGEYKQSKIRYYAAENKKYQEPLVFVAPLAIKMDIYDLYPYRSLVKYYTEQGFDVYLVDWGKFGYKDHHLSFIHFIDEAIPSCIDQIRSHSKSDQVSLHGWSMAGVFVMLYTALREPNYVKNLIVLGSPVDSYASGSIGRLYERVNTLLERHHLLQHKIYQGAIPKRLTHTPGILNAIGFKILDPKGWYEGHKQLLMNLDNTKLLHEHATLGFFLNHMIDYPGGVNQDMLLNIWLRNPLKNGVIELQDKKIELKNIRCSLLVGAGRSDQMVTADAVRPLTELTNSPDVTFTLIPGGHLGLMSNQNSADEFWPKLANWLAERSTPI